MEQVRLSNFDRLLNIHQSVALHQTRKINKKILEEQIYQNAKLQHLNNQLSAANEINRKLLENQIKEIKEKETLKFYKDLSFKMHVFLEYIENIVNPLVKKYFVSRYYEKIKTNLVTSDNYLAEISDKLFNKEILTRINTLKESGENFETQFNNSPFSKIDSLIDALSIEKRKISNFSPPLFKDVEIKIKPKTSVARIIGMLFFGIPSFLFLISTIALIFERNFNVLIGASVLLACFLIPFLIILKKSISWKKSYPNYIQSQLELKQVEHEKTTEVMLEYQKELDKLNNDLLQHPSYITYEQLVNDYPEFESAISTLNDLESQYFANELDFNPNDRDPLFAEVAKVVVQCQQASTSLIQRKFKIKSNRAARILDQLEDAKIVGQFNGSKARDILITDLHSLTLHLRES